MAYEIIIHGKPQSLDYYGIEEDRDYIKSLYRSQEQPNQMVIDTRVIGGKLYCYYHYLVYSNVVEYETNRKGSYIGITARFDNYCVEAKKVFLSLEFIYRNFCVGSIVRERGGVTCFTIPSFNEPQARESLAKAKSSAEDLFQQSFSIRSFIDFSAHNFRVSSPGQTTKRNSEECTEEDMMKIVQSGSMLILSGAFPSQALVQKEQSLLGNLDKLTINHKNELSKRDAQFQSMARELEQTKRQIMSISSEVEQYKSALRDVEKSISRFRTPANKTSEEKTPTVEQIKSAKANGTSTSNRLKSFSTNILLIICTLIIVSALIASLFLKKDSVAMTTSPVPTTHQTATVPTNHNSTGVNPLH